MFYIFILILLKKYKIPKAKKIYKNKTKYVLKIIFFIIMTT